MARLTGLLVVVGFLAAAATPAAAQQIGYNPGSSIGASLNPAYDTLLNNTIRRPTVSPYLQLTLGGQSGTTYHTLVKPALEQERINRESASRLSSLQQQFNSAVSSPYRNRGGDERVRGTGHQSGFMIYGHYYNNLSQFQQRR